MAGASDVREREDGAAEAPLTPAVFHIMLALADGERHGYSILREVERYTEGRLKLGPTTLYRSIRQMLAAGYIEESEARPDPDLDDERRRYYRLTDAGDAWRWPRRGGWRGWCTRPSRPHWASHLAAQR